MYGTYGFKTNKQTIGPGYTISLKTNWTAMSVNKHLWKLPAWWHVVNGLLGPELLGFPTPTLIAETIREWFLGFQGQIWKYTLRTKTQDGPNTLCSRWAMLNRVLKAWMKREQIEFKIYVKHFLIQMLWKIEKEILFDNLQNLYTWTFLGVRTTLSLWSTNSSKRFDPGDCKVLLRLKCKPQKVQHCQLPNKTGYNLTQEI